MSKIYMGRDPTGMAPYVPSVPKAILARAIECLIFLLFCSARRRLVTKTCREKTSGTPCAPAKANIVLTDSRDQERWSLAIIKA